MIMTATLLFNLMCPTTEIINRTDSWKAEDNFNMKVAKKVCKKRYASSNKECLVRFYKFRKLGYGAICGYKRPASK